MNNGSSSDVKLIEPEIVDKTESVVMIRESEILNCDESVDLQKSPTPEVWIERFDRTARDHTGVNEAMELVYKEFCWSQFRCAAQGYWGVQFIVVVAEWRVTL